MPDAVLHAAALAASVLGMAWLALAMEVHWDQVRGTIALPARTARGLRLLGAAGLATSLALCLAVDHASMAVLMWVMGLAAAALAVAFTLTWRPRWLMVLMPWVVRDIESA
jgi:hypothetical protein